mmetsp:Transcript_22055/g.35060  ORF Transcript_22055/g.35060 Transcript_22055/m.35060 type:complete len:1184 (+) Transcript_22055:122-3673(+)
MAMEFLLVSGFQHSSEKEEDDDKLKGMTAKLREILEDSEVPNAYRAIVEMSQEVQSLPRPRPQRKIPKIEEREPQVVRLEDSGYKRAAPKPRPLDSPTQDFATDDTMGKSPVSRTPKSHARTPSSAVARKYVLSEGLRCNTATSTPRKAPSGGIRFLKQRRLKQSTSEDSAAFIHPKAARPQSAPFDRRSIPNVAAAIQSMGMKVVDEVGDGGCESSDEDSVVRDWRALYAQAFQALHEQQKMLHTFWECIEKLEEQNTELRACIKDDAEKLELCSSVEKQLAALESQQDLVARVQALQEQKVKAHERASTLQLALKKMQIELRDAQAKLKDTEAQLQGMMTWKTKMEEDIHNATVKTAVQGEPAPVGTVTFVFSEIQGSSLIWEADPEYAQAALHAHNNVFKVNIKQHCGYQVKVVGDCYMIAFQRTLDAVNFCLQSQLDMMELQIPAYSGPHLPELASKSYTDDAGQKVAVWQDVRLQMGVHSGLPYSSLNPITQHTDFYGPVIHKAARIQAQGQGGVVVCSKTIYDDVNRHTEKLPKHYISFWRDICHVGPSADIEPLFRMVPLSLLPRLRDLDAMEDDCRDESTMASKIESASSGLMTDYRFTSFIGPVAIIDLIVNGMSVLMKEHVRSMRIAIAMYNNLLDLSLEGVPAYKLPRQGYSRTTIIFKSAHPGLLALQWCIRLQQTLLEHQWPPDLLEHPLCEPIYYKAKLVFRGLRIQTGIHSCEIVPTLKDGEQAGTTEEQEVQRAHDLARASYSGEILITKQVYEEAQGYVALMYHPTIEAVQRVLRGEEGSFFRVFPSSLAERCYLHEFFEECATWQAEDADIDGDTEAELWMMWEGGLSGAQQRVTTGDDGSPHVSSPRQTDAQPFGAADMSPHGMQGDHFSPSGEKLHHRHPRGRHGKKVDHSGRSAVPRGKRTFGYQRSLSASPRDDETMVPQIPTVRAEMLCVYKAMLTQTKTMDLTKAWKHRVMQRLEGCVAMCLDPLVPEKDLIVPVFGLDRRETVTVETVWEDARNVIMSQKQKIKTLNDKLRLAQSNHPKDMILLHRALRIYFRLLKDYVESFVPEPLYVLTESELVYRWVTTCGELMKERGTNRDLHKGKIKNLWKDLTNFALDTDHKEQIFKGDNGKLFRSALGLMARFFVRLKTHMHDCRRLQAAAWESDAEGRRDDHQAHRDHAW